jgi:hypothetical protein
MDSNPTIGYVGIKTLPRESRNAVKMNPAILLGSLFAVLMLTACGHLEETYPSTWATIDPTRTDRQCPDISGLYAEMGELTESGCQWQQEKCHHLSYNLLGGNIGYTEVWDDTPYPAFSTSTTHVELIQQDDQAIDVILWVSGNKNGEPTMRNRIVGQQRLSVDEGDFSCSEDGLRLRTRSIYFVFGIDNLVGFENRTFNRTGDRDLVMRSEELSIGNMVIVPIGSNKTIWVRWKYVEDAPP